jgi:hypothetical protein
LTVSSARLPVLSVLGCVLLATAFPARADAAAPPTWKSRMAAAEHYAETRSGTIGFAVVDEAGRLHGYHAARPARSASLLKPMLLVAYLRRPDVRRRDLASWERRLLSPMIRRSANTNVPRLIGLVGERRLARLAEAAGMERFTLNMPFWGASETTARGQARFFHRIDKLVPALHRVYAMRLLATVVPSQRWGVGRVPRSGWRLYFKGGWSTGTGRVDHQVALYPAGGERFSLAFFTQFDPDHEYGKETLRGLAVRLLQGVPGPGRRLPRVARAALSRRYSMTAGDGCGAVTIRPVEGAAQKYATGAASCAGFHLALAGRRALWSLPEEGAERLATAEYGSPGVTDLGEFDSSDPLGPIAGNGGTLAYAHGGEVTIVGGPDCSTGTSALAVGGGRIAAASGDMVEVLDPTTCVVDRSVDPLGAVDAVALDDGIVAALSHGPAGRAWLEWFRISTGARLGKKEVAAGTLPSLAVRSPWILYRAPHALRVLATRSGRAWTVWRPRRAQLGARLVGRHIGWVENGAGHARFWSFRLPADD